MDDAVKIREAMPADYEAVAGLTLSAYRALSTWVGDDYAAELADVAGRVAGGGTVLVAEDAGGAVVGSVTLVLPPAAGSNGAMRPRGTAGSGCWPWTLAPRAGASGRRWWRSASAGPGPPGAGE